MILMWALKLLPSIKVMLADPEASLLQSCLICRSDLHFANLCAFVWGHDPGAPSRGSARHIECLTQPLEVAQPDIHSIFMDSQLAGGILLTCLALHVLTVSSCLHATSSNVRQFAVHKQRLHMQSPGLCQPLHRPANQSNQVSFPQNYSKVCVLCISK